MAEKDPEHHRHAPPHLPPVSPKAPIQLAYSTWGLEPRPSIVGPFIAGAILTTILGGILAIFVMVSMAEQNFASQMVLAHVFFLGGVALFVGTLVWFIRGDKLHPFLLGMLAGVGVAILLAGFCFGL